MKLYIYAGLAFVVCSGIWSIYATYMDLRGFKDQILDQQSKVLESVMRQEKDLSNAVTSISDQLYDQASAIDDNYNALLAKRQRLHNSTANSNANVPSIAYSTKDTSNAAQAKSFAVNRSVSSKLRQCEERLIYEAKEYDNLASQYNALLNIYKHAQGVLNGNKENNGGKEKHH